MSKKVTNVEDLKFQCYICGGVFNNKEMADEHICKVCKENLDRK